MEFDRKNWKFLWFIELEVNGISGVGYNAGLETISVLYEIAVLIFERPTDHVGGIYVQCMGLDSAEYVALASGCMHMGI